MFSTQGVRPTRSLHTLIVRTAALTLAAGIPCRTSVAQDSPKIAAGDTAVVVRPAPAASTQRGITLVATNPLGLLNGSYGVEGERLLFPSRNLSLGVGAGSTSFDFFGAAKLTYQGMDVRVRRWSSAKPLVGTFVGATLGLVRGESEVVTETCTGRGVNCSFTSESSSLTRPTIGLEVGRNFTFDDDGRWLFQSALHIRRVIGDLPLQTIPGVRTLIAYRF